MADRNGCGQPQPPCDGEKPGRVARGVGTVQRYLEKRRTEKKQQTAADRAARSTARATWAIAFLTIATIGVGIAQFHIYRGQLDEMRATREGGDKSMADQMNVMRTQAKVMQGQLDLLAQQMKDARQTQRAFITASNFTVTRVDRGPDTSCWSFNPTIVNDGGTPTVHMEYMQQIVVSTYPFVGLNGSAYGLVLAPSDPEDEFQKFVGWTTALLGPKQPLPVTTGMGVACLNERTTGSLFATERIYARGVIHYRDIYSETDNHITKYCFWIQSEQKGKGFVPHVVLCKHWNCADEECEKDAKAYAAAVADAFAKTNQTLKPPVEYFPQ